MRNSSIGRLFAVGLGLVALCSATGLRAQSSDGTREPLIGTWGCQLRVGTPVEGELTLESNAGHWSASVAGYHLVATEAHGEVRLSLPGDRGSFRGRMDPNTRVMRGHWIQPAGEILSPYASPMELKPLSGSSWRGKVVPLEQAFSVYAVITLGPGGKLSAVLSNPEMNFFRGRTFVVTREGSNVHFDAKGWKLDGAYDEKTDSLSLKLQGISTTIQLSHQTRDDAVGLYPRVPHDTGPYLYREPLPQKDGWQVASLAEEHLDSSRVSELVQRILLSAPESDTLNIQSLLIARHGRLVLEEYFYGFDDTRTHDMRSAGKTFAPVLVGIARQQGAKLAPDTPIYPLFKQYTSFANWDSRKQLITLRDIMTMSAGNACDDNDDDSPGNEDRMQSDPANKDWYKYTLDLPMRTNPGGHNAVYCSADLNLVGGAVAATTGRWLPDFFDQYLARPLQFGKYYLNLMPDGQAYMGGGAYIRPRDELKLGQLFLNGGVWNGHRIVATSWVQDAIASHTAFDPRYSLGQRHEYGFGWHINFLKSGGKTYRVYAAGGNGGQFIIVVPDLDLVIGLNGGSYGQFDRWYRWELELVPQYILPAVSGSAELVPG
jgi:CubicO group peptidase (beta-lactamase class C family)